MDDRSQSILNACFYGLARPYHEYFSLMKNLHAEVALGAISHQLMLLEHTPVITFTRSHQHKSLLSSPELITKQGIDLYEADRGGDATFHGPGQLVGYLLIKLNKLSIEAYIRSLEHAVLTALKNLGLKQVQTLPGYTGIWVKAYDINHKISVKKLCAIGVGIKDNVSKHGFALNITINPEPFIKHIIPCGLKDRGVATLKQAFSQEHLEMPAYLDIVKEISKSIAQTFSLELCFKGL